MADFNYSQVPAVVTITATHDVVIPMAGKYLLPTQYITLKEGDVLKVAAMTSTEMVLLSKACEDLGIIPEIDPITEDEDKKDVTTNTNSSELPPAADQDDSTTDEPTTTEVADQEPTKDDSTTESDSKETPADEPAADESESTEEA